MTEQTQLYEDYSQVLEQVAATPYDRAVHLRHIELLTQLGLDDEVDSAIDLYATHFAIQPGTQQPVSTVSLQQWTDSHRLVPQRAGFLGSRLRRPSCRPLGPSRTSLPSSVSCSFTNAQFRNFYVRLSPSPTRLVPA